MINDWEKKKMKHRDHLQIRPSSRQPNICCVFSCANITHAVLIISLVPLPHSLLQELMSLPFLSYWCGKRKPPYFPQTYLPQSYKKSLITCFQTWNNLDFCNHSADVEIALMLWLLTVTFSTCVCDTAAPVCGANPLNRMFGVFSLQASVPPTRPRLRLVTVWVKVALQTVWNMQRRRGLLHALMHALYNASLLGYLTRSCPHKKYICT